MGSVACAAMRLCATACPPYSRPQYVGMPCPVNTSQFAMFDSASRSSMDGVVPADPACEGPSEDIVDGGACLRVACWLWCGREAFR